MENKFRQPVGENSNSEYYRNLIEKEQIELKTFFVHYLPKELKPHDIVNFCCGVANEESILYDLYGNDISLVSFDRSEDMIRIARELSLERKSIIKLDTKDINAHFKGLKFDLLIGRNIPINPNNTERYSNEISPDEWPQFLQNLKSHFNRNGYLLMTFAREDEFERAKELLNKLNYNLIVQEKNAVVVPSDRIGIAGADVKDNYVVIANLNKSPD